MWCWKVIKISWIDRVRDEEVWQSVNEEINILLTIKRSEANWIGHILHKDCLIKHVTEGEIEERIEVTERWGRRREQLLNILKEEIRYCKLKEEALDRTVRRTRFGRGEGRIEVTERWGRRCKHLLNILKEEIRYCKLKEEALDRTVWRTGFGIGEGRIEATERWGRRLQQLLNILKKEIRYCKLK